MPPIEAGSDPPGPVKTSDSTVASSAIAKSSSPIGRHQRWSLGSADPSSSSTSRHNLRAKT
jgi:hypothetical protein